MKNKVQASLLLLTIFMISLVSTACTSTTLKPETALWGTWAYTSSDMGNFAFAYDLHFEEDGNLILHGSPYGQVTYVVIAPGQMKLTMADQSEVISYQVADGLLTFSFQEGQYQYRRIITAEPTAEALPIIEQDTPTSAPEALLPTETPSLAAPTQTPFVVEITPSNTPTQLTPSIEPTDYNTPTPERYFPLQNCAASQLRLGDSAFVDYDGGKNSLRETPDTHPSDNIIGYIYPGDVVEIIDGPVCNYGWVLWKVMTTTYEEAWTPETDGEEFWILPVTTRQLCSDTLPTRLIEGQQAFVMEEFDLSNFIRQMPSLSSDIISRIQPGGKMMVLDGPVCSDGSNWWKIQTLATNVIGWTRENDARRYYLAPIP